MSVRERKQRERHARRENILAAAAQVFAAHGVDGATVEMVAREAEVAVGTIYLYFSSRDDLFVSLMAERIAKLRARYREIHACSLAPLDELRAIGRAYFDYLRESRGLFLAQLSVTFSQLSLRLSRADELEHFEQVRRLGRECFELYRDSVKRWLARRDRYLGRAQRRLSAHRRRRDFPRHHRARSVAPAGRNLRIPARRGRGRGQAPDVGGRIRRAKDAGSPTARPQARAEYRRRQGLARSASRFARARAASAGIRAATE